MSVIHDTSEEHLEILPMLTVNSNTFVNIGFL